MKFFGLVGFFLATCLLAAELVHPCGFLFLFNLLRSGRGDGLVEITTMALAGVTLPVGVEVLGAASRGHFDAAAQVIAGDQLQIEMRTKVKYFKTPTGEMPEAGHCAGRQRENENKTT